MTLDPVSAVIEVGGKLIDRLWPDPTVAAAAKLELVKLEQAGELQVLVSQLEINKVEAAHESIFVSGWRPAIGWTCVAAYAYNFVLQPFLVLLLTAIFTKPLILPTLDLGEIGLILCSILGVGALRSYEKVKGV